MSAPKYLGTLGERSVKLGIDLTTKEQKEVLDSYVHRFTGEHRPAWTNRADCAHCPVQFKDDADWLANTFFLVTKTGRLARVSIGCESHPTWPEGKAKASR